MCLLRLKFVIGIVSIPASISTISSAYSKNSRPCVRSFRVMLECRKIQRKRPPRCARRQTRIIYRQYAKSHEKAVSVENLRVVSLRAARKSIYFTNGKPLHNWESTR